MSAAHLPAGTTATTAPLEALSLAADALAYPLLALQIDGSLLHANLAARELLERGTPFQLTVDAQVSPRAAPRRGAFLAALRAAATGMTQTLNWPDGEDAVLASVSPLARARHGEPTPPVMLALALQAGSTFDTRGFAAEQGLTEAEMRVLDLLLQGLGAQATADRLGVHVSTVRSQIVSIRRKSGHHGVPALLASVAAGPPRLHPRLGTADGQREGE